jgi:hypothetical protein
LWASARRTLPRWDPGHVAQASITDSLGNPIAGPPTTQVYQFEQARDMNGVLWLSSSTGSWRRSNTLRVDNTAGTGPFQPVRIIDTRNGTGGKSGMRSANSSTTWGPFPGTNGIPSDAIGIVGNVTVTSYTGNGFLAVFPAGASYNPASSPSTMNYSTNWAWANAFTVGFGTGANAGPSCWWS